MIKRNSQRRSDRSKIDPPEVGMIYLAEAGDVSGTNPASAPKKLFVDLVNRSPEGVGIHSEKKIKPAGTKLAFDSCSTSQGRKPDSTMARKMSRVTVVLIMENRVLSTVY